MQFSKNPTVTINQFQVFLQIAVISAHSFVLHNTAIDKPDKTARSSKRGYIFKAYIEFFGKQAPLFNLFLLASFRLTQF